MIPRYSQACIDLVKESEGLRLQCYDDAVGLKTIGFGHLLARGEDFESVTHAEADALLAADLDRHWMSVARLVAIDMTQGQVDGCVSLAFNIGETAFGQSTLLRRLNEGNPTAAADEFLRWTHGGGNVLPGLVTRREKERALFLSDMT